jgi:hypothetical protein
LNDGDLSLQKLEWSQGEIAEMTEIQNNLESQLRETEAENAQQKASIAEVYLPAIATPEANSMLPNIVHHEAISAAFTSSAIPLAFLRQPFPELCWHSQQRLSGRSAYRRSF